ncbi:hypothetical protein [Heyndrickxia acidicola]|uniref:Phasin family protein n=1 Tax=Heyndrickxia acidicola TaxID=209389 RepID=A0ABU6ML82_9BACI|nr:hypothetical protein [Heyndrickxia acidicola]MED1205448.1 hypothetical protein [Heyndrickxia acidicola]
MNYFSQLKEEAPQYAEVFNQLFMQAVSQGISMFAEGAYDAARAFGESSGVPGETSLSP